MTFLNLVQVLSLIVERAGDLGLKQSTSTSSSSSSLTPAPIGEWLYSGEVGYPQASAELPLFCFDRAV